MARYAGRRDSFAVGSLMKLMGENLEEHFMLYKKEFYLLWYTGIRGDFIPEETVAVCNVSIDDGSTTVIRVFHAGADDEHRAEDRLLEWLDDDPYINSSNRLDMDIFMNLSPHAAFAKAFSNLMQLFADQEKVVNIEMKIVKMALGDEDDMEYFENREGLIDLHEAGVKLSPVTGKDWTYLREVLRDNTGLSAQEKNGRSTRLELQYIVSAPEHAAVNTESPEARLHGQDKEESSSSDEGK